MKCVELRPNADPDIAAWKLVEIASTIEPVQGDRIFVELINAPFLYEHKGSPLGGQGRPRSGDRKWLAHAPRERHLCAFYGGRRGVVSLTAREPPSARRTSPCAWRHCRPHRRSAETRSA